MVAICEFSGKIIIRGVKNTGKYVFGIVTVGERGQIVIPERAREAFNIERGDRLIIVGDEKRGMAASVPRAAIKAVPAQKMREPLGFAIKYIRYYLSALGPKPSFLGLWP